MTKKERNTLSFIIDRNTAAYFDFFKNLIYFSRSISEIKDKSITHNILRIQDNVLLCLGFFYQFFDRLYKFIPSKFSPKDYKKNDNMIYKYCKHKYNKCLSLY